MESLARVASKVPAGLLPAVDAVLRESFSSYQRDGWPQLGLVELADFQGFAPGMGTVDPVGVRYVPTPSRGYITAAPDAAFFTQSTSGQHGLILFRPDGAPFLTIGTFGGSGFTLLPIAGVYDLGRP